MKLLHINASPRGINSRTLSISEEFLKSLQSRFPELIVETLNLFDEKLPEFVDTHAAIKYDILSRKLLSEESVKHWNVIADYARVFLAADIYLISTPMWNYSIPYKLKHYIDIIMQPGLLFQYSIAGVEGLAKNKKMFCISTRGNDYSEGSPMHQFDFMEPYLKSIFGLAGITDISFIHAQPMDFTSEITKAMLEKGIKEAKELAANYSIALAEPV